MPYIYHYSQYGHLYFSNNLKKISVLSRNYDDKILIELETLSGGIFSKKRLIFQLENLFSEKRGWRWPLNEIISKKLYKIITTNPIFKYGNIDKLKYQELRRGKKVGIFKTNDKNNKSNKSNNCLTYLCIFFCGS